jgi:hypothetical protein
MLRDATHEPLIKRTVMLQLDDEGVLDLHQEVLAGLLEGDALGIPGPPPTCETCWAEAAGRDHARSGPGGYLRGSRLRHRPSTGRRPARSHPLVLGGSYPLPNGGAGEEK